MVINETRTGDTLTIAPEGRLDTNSAPELDAFLKKYYASITELVVDCSRLDYVSSAGLRVFLSARKALQNKGPVRILNANKLILEVLNVTGLAELFEFR